MFLSLTLHERNLLSLDFLENISKAATTLFLEQKEKKETKVPPQVAQQQENVSVAMDGGWQPGMVLFVCCLDLHDFHAAFFPSKAQVCRICMLTQAGTTPIFTGTG